MDEKLVMIMTAICALTICLVLSVIVQWRRSEKVRRRMRYYALIVSIGCLFVNLETGISILVICMMVNIGLYFYGRKSLEGAMKALQYFLRLQTGAEKILKKKLIPDADYEQRLRENYIRLKRKLGNMTLLRPPNWDDQSPAEMLLDYLRMITHIDDILFYRCMRRLSKDIDVVENLITTMGLLESILVIGSLRIALPYYCIPEFKSGGNLEIEDAYHPLIPNPVPNSIQAEGGVLVTGSNASGKSTFLKTIALNSILAQALHTCAAKSYSGKWYTILSSMALRDNLYCGESYYIAEIKALKRVLDTSQVIDADSNEKEGPIKSGENILCFIDEVLRGTNTVERIAASTQILKTFRKKQIICFAATHDIELTYLLENVYQNYHFQEKVVDGEIQFDYRIYKGRSNSKNKCNSAVGNTGI